MVSNFKACTFPGLNKASMGVGESLKLEKVPRWVGWGLISVWTLTREEYGEAADDTEMVSQESQSNKSRRGKTLRNVEIVVGYLTRALVESWSPVSSQGGLPGGRGRGAEQEARALSAPGPHAVTLVPQLSHLCRGFTTRLGIHPSSFHSSFPLCPFEGPALLRSRAKEFSAALGCYGCLVMCFVLFHLFHEKRDNHHQISMSLKGLEATWQKNTSYSFKTWAGEQSKG